MRLSSRTWGEGSFVAIAAAMLAAGGASAQTVGTAPAGADQSAPAADQDIGGDEQRAIEDIVVSGTRIVRDGYNAPTPVTVVGLDQLQSSATPNIADYVNTLPVFNGSATTHDERRVCPAYLHSHAIQHALHAQAGPRTRQAGLKHGRRLRRRGG